MTETEKKAWVEALRSGKYEQGKGSLRENDRYCCLGVLCHIEQIEWAKQHGEFSFVEDEGTEGIYVAIKDGSWSSHYLPEGFHDELKNNRIPDNLAKALEIEPEQSWERALGNLNDFRQLSFSEIADIIETYL